jgi:hypothetical protein
MICKKWLAKNLESEKVDDEKVTLCVQMTAVVCRCTEKGQRWKRREKAGWLYTVLFIVENEESVCLTQTQKLNAAVVWKRKEELRRRQFC